MIIYDLRCAQNHQFEGWFKTPEDFHTQNKGELLSCPVCGSSEVAKLPTASRINRLSGSGAGPEQDLVSQKQDFLEKMHDYVDSNYIDVGSEFAEQARKIHYGEVESAAIRGTATQDEARELHEEGVDIVSLPPAPLDKEKLN